MPACTEMAALLKIYYDKFLNVKKINTLQKCIHWYKIVHIGTKLYALDDD